ncbi:MAG: amidohydrolase, partial [Bacteroidetes bacterium]|nr:amidohydrolase [Bacteroidota bacterium]
MLKYIFTFMLAASIGFMIAQPEVGSMLIKNGTVLTVTNGTLENTDVLIVDGKISKIGKNLKAPKGAKEVDATGMHVMPGIIDAHSHIALDAINESTSPVTAEVWTGDAVDPLDIGIYRALAGGVTATHNMHGSANAIGGQCETLKMRWGLTDPDALRV